MPTQKDLKHLTRTRMKKTGESYTAARAQLLKKKASPASAESPAHAKLAGMSDAAVRAKTGKSWAQWVRALDAVDAAAMPHREIAEYVHELGVPDWWAQTVTVGYERIRGLRDRGQRRGGGYEATKSRTFPVPLAKLYRAFATAPARSRWLEGVKLIVRTRTQNKSMRIAWGDGTSVHFHFTARGDSKSQVAVQHVKLVDRAHAARMKELWAERLGVLAETLG